MWVFVAGLTALLLGAGALAGGALLDASVASAAALNIVGCWLSEKVAAKAAGGRPLTEAEAPGLHAVISELARRAKRPVPRLSPIPSATGARWAAPSSAT